MKTLRSILLIITITFLYLSCQREIFFDGTSMGRLKKDASDNCLPIISSGSYKVDSVLTGKNFIEVEVEVSYPGTFDILSDTVNGYFFHQTGDVEKGTHTIRLTASGKPIATGINNFTARYGTSSCNFRITALGPQAAVYTLTGAPNTCTGFLADGTYTINTSLTPSNILTVQVNVTIPGTYNLSAVTTNGFSFFGSGVFTSTGVQNVILKGTGTPKKAEISTVTINNILSTCNFGINVLSDTAGKAIFSFEGTPGVCTNYTVNENYFAQVTTTASNTVTMSVNVTKPGTYSINTNTADGISFSNSGLFSNTGTQTITLTATGTPLNSGPTAFIPNTGTQSCNFIVLIQPLPPPAAFVLSGAPTACTPITVNGFYIVSKPLDNANTVTIQVNVSTPGSYTISTNTVNGFSFSASGVFTTTGLHNVTLRGNGTPLATGTTVLTPNYITSSCTFSVTVQ